MMACFQRQLLTLFLLLSSPSPWMDVGVLDLLLLEAGTSEGVGIG
jgi:hypothetical protein